MDDNKSKLTAYVALSFSVLIWGSSYLAIEAALDTLEALEFTAVRMLCTAAIFLPMLLIWRFHESKKILRQDLLLISVLGLVGVAGYHIFTNLSEERVPSSVTGLIIGLVPISTMALEAVIGYEKFTRNWVIGAMIAISGLVFVMLSTPSKGTATHLYLGSFFALVSAIIWAIYTVLCRPLINKGYSSMAIVGWASIIACASAPFCWSAQLTDKLLQASLMFWMIVVFLCLLSSVAAYLCYNFALTKLSASKVSESVYFIPPCAVFTGWLLGKFLLKKDSNQIGGLFLIGAALIVAGVYISGLKSTEAEKE